MSTNTDIATRVYNHKWQLDPIWRSFLDTDFYKFLMAQFIWRYYREVDATFYLKNRTQPICLGKEINESALRDQLDYARTVKLTRGESTWLRGNTFYGRRQIFDSDFMDWLENFTLPQYHLNYDQNGDLLLEFEGKWIETTFWEIPALSIINELRSRSALNKLSKFEIDVTYARAKAKLWDKAQHLKILYAGDYHFKVSDFGTRRRHSFLWQRWAVQAMQEAIGTNFIGTSNALMAMQNNLEAIGTSAHELPMVVAALAEDDAQLRTSPYEILQRWEQTYFGNLLIVLPDAFGTTNFLNADGNVSVQQKIACWKGIRPDSKPWRTATQECIDFWKHHGQDPKQKLVILSDGMDVDSIENSVKQFSNQTNISIGWGTNLTNDFKGCLPDNSDALKAISLVCKVKSANGRPCVKLSDNLAKAMGDPQEIQRYKKVFNYSGIESKVDV